MTWTDLKLRMRALVGRTRAEADLNDELEFHLAMQSRRHQAGGMDPAEAARLARAQFGGIPQVAEECRDARGLNWLDGFLQDVRYACRGIARRPGFALTVVGTIALGLGLNTTLFTIFNAYALRPLAVRDPFSLYQLSWITRGGGGRFFTAGELREIRAGNPAFSEMLSYEPVFAKTEGRSMLGNRVSGNYFTMLGAGFAVGRPLLDDDALAGIPAAVISYSTWKNRFGGDPAILGRKLPMFGADYEVVGVTRPEFHGVAQVLPDFWIPLAATGDPGTPPNSTIVGRLKPRMSQAQATAAMLVWSQQLTAGRPEDQRVRSVQLQPNATTIPMNPEAYAAFAPVAGAFALVLLIACANVANMMLARAVSRQREIAVRLSLGAHRRRLVRQLVTESLVLALPAAVAGYAVSQATIRMGEHLLFATMPPVYSSLFHPLELSPDRSVFLFLLAASIFAALVFGLAPALQATRTPLIAAARGDFAGGFRPSRLRNALVVGQVTACVLLLIVAGLLLRGGQKLADRDPGLATHGVMNIQLSPPAQSKILEALKSDPSIELAATAWHAPLAGSLRGISVAPDGAALQLRAGYNFVAPEYFPLLRIPLTRGRNFTAEEAAAEASVAIVSEATARLLWPNQNPLGRRIRIAPGGRADRGNKLPSFPIADVIGVAADVVSGVIWDGKDATCIYFPTNAGAASNGALLVRFRSDSEPARRALDRLLDRVAATAILRVTPMDELLAAQIYPFRISFAISSFLGGLALLLTLSGIYGVLAFLVTQRTREIGIRIALGATASAVTRGVLLQSVRLSAIGIAIGVVLSLAVSRLFASVLEGVDSYDAIAYAGGVAAVIAGAIAAAWIPSRCAAGVDPASTLRYD